MFSAVIFLFLVAAIVLLIIGAVKKSKGLIIAGIASGVIFAALFYVLGKALENM